MKTLFTLFLGLIISLSAFSQQQLQNGDFESWDDVGTAEEEPTNWSSLKTADALAGTAPSVLSSDAGHNGGQCAKLEVKEVPIVGIKANGIMTNGRVHADFNPANGYVYTEPNDARWYTTFTDKPDSIVGWYKYAPQNGDKGKVEIILHVNDGKLPYNGTQGNMIARAKYEFTSAQANWTRFAKAFSYASTADPQYILTTITSGDSTISQTGSTLWIDDLSLVYNTSSIDKNEKYEFAINGSDGYLYFDVQNETTRYQVSDISGKIIQSGNAKNSVPFKHNSGIYFINIQSPEGNFTKKLYIH